MIRQNAGGAYGVFTYLPKPSLRVCASGPEKSKSVGTVTHPCRTPCAMKRPRHYLAFAGLLLPLLPVFLAPAAAQVAGAEPLLDASELKRLTVEQLLQQEVVSVSRRPEALRGTASNVYLISGEAARAVGATTLPELLRLAPSFFVAQSSSYHWGVNARGFMRTNAHSNKLLVLIDGRTAYLPLFSNVFWDSTDAFIPDLDSAEVISGPGGSNWGSNAVNGVINIRSKSAHDTLGGLVQVTAGTNGLQGAWRQGFKVGAGGAMRVYAKHTERDASFSSTGADDDHDRWQTNQAGFRADWGKADAGELTVQGDWLSGRYDALPMPAVRNDAGHLLARWGRSLSADSSVWLRAYYDYSMRDSSGTLLEETRTADVEFQHSVAFADSQQLLWGANYRRIVDTATEGVGLVILPERLGMSLASVFGQHEVRWAGDELRLTSGLRFEHTHFTGWEYQPSVRLAWQRARNTVWAAAARVTRTPSRIEKGFFAPEEPPYFIAGGPEFVSEVVKSYEVGWRGNLARGLALTTTLYYHEYDGLRSVEPGPPVIQANGVAGRSQGFEWFLDYDVTRFWRFRAGGFVMDQDTWVKPGSRDLEGGNGEGSFPAHQVFVRSNFRLGSKVDLWLSLRRIGEVPAYEDGNGIVPAYTSLNAHLSWRVRPGLQLALVGRNLLDESHPEIGGLAARREIRRSLAASVRWEY